MKPIKVKFTVQQRSEGQDPVKIEMEGTLVSFGIDAGKEGGSWSTGIIVLPDGRFCNTAIEFIRLKEPFKEEDWPA